MYNYYLDREGNQKLTPREHEVLQFMIEGLSNQEIADKLQITHHTSKAHVSSILYKLGVQNRTSAVRVALVKNLDV